MGDFIKSKLKDLKVALGNKDWPNVEKHATAVLSFESNNYNARVFLALALFNLERFDESEETYKKAIEAAPSQALARQGLASFYEKRQRWSDYAWALQELMQLFLSSQDATKYAEVLQKLIDVRRAHGTRQEVIDTLSLVLPSSPSYPLLATLPAPSPTNPTASSFHAIQLAVSSPLNPLLELISLVEADESDVVETEIKKRRQRLGGTTMSAADTRRAVEGQFMRSSRLPGLYKQVLDDPDASDQEDLRRETERKLLIHLCTLLRALPSSWDETSLDLKKAEKKAEVKAEEDDMKNSVRRHVEELAKDMVTIRVREETAWLISMEWSDRYGAWQRVDWRELSRYAEYFEDSGLAQIAVGMHKRLLASQADVEEGVEPVDAPDDDAMAAIIETGLATSPDSTIAHLLATHFFAEQREWEAVMQVAEAGLTVTRRLEASIGRGLLDTRRTLESHLALALVNFDPPTHHLRALRLLDSLIKSSSSPDTALLGGKARVLQSSEKWQQAIEVWDLVLANDPSHGLKNEAVAEKSWSLYHAGELQASRDGFEQVIQALEARKKVRDEERAAQEKFRSKAGIEKGEGVEEGESSEEALERATCWYRLGQCLWGLGAEEPELSDTAYDAYLNAIRARTDFAPAFTALGIYYRSVSPPDYERASKCFQKAFELDGGQEVAARYLAEEFALVHEWSLVEVIARRVVSNNKGRAAMGGKAAQRLAWAHKAIGGSELSSKHYPQAIVSLQAALRGEPQDVHTWIKLGLAYRHSGKFIAALKVFVRALELDPESWYARFSIGDVQREIGLLGPALDTFRSVLKDRPEELGVKVVLADTLLTAGLEEARTGFVARAEQSFVDALRVAVEIVEGGSATRIAWKVSGDALVGLGKIVEGSLSDTARALADKISALLGKHDIDSKVESMGAVTVKELLPLAGESTSSAFFTALAVLVYKMRVLLETQNESAIGAAWFDLGVALAATRPHLDSLGLTATSETVLHQAVRCLKFALHKEPVNAVFWNALGSLSFDLSPRLAQHCFIKSIEYNSRTAVPWTNLGLFYLVHGDDDLANQAFLKAQVIDPDWAAAWVGQATLADMAGHAAEATVLLEHAFSLGATTPEADIAFATRAFHKYTAAHATQVQLEDGVDRAAELSAPLFAITRYLSQRPDDATALHLNALILEQVGDLEAASASLEKAATVLEGLYEVDESPQTEAQYVIAQTNLGRVRLARDEYSGALEAFEAALTLLDIEQEATDGVLSREQTLLLYIESKLGSGLAHHWLGDAGSAETVFEGALEDLDGIDNVNKAALAVSLGRVYWAEGDENRALGSFLDAPNSFIAEAPVFVKLALHALAIVTADSAILGTVTRMLSLNDDTDTRVTQLSVLQHLATNDLDSALSVVCRALHATPWKTFSRRAVGRVLLAMPVSSPPNPNIDICARFLRQSVPISERSIGRSERALAWGKIEISKEGREKEALRWVEAAMYRAPWDPAPRKMLVSMQKAFES